MTLGKEMLNVAVFQVAQWAQNWVENETCIPEAAKDKLTEGEKAGLLLLEIMLKAEQA